MTRQVRHLQRGDHVAIRDREREVRSVHLPSHRGRRATVEFTDGTTLEAWGDDAVTVLPRTVVRP